MVVPVLAVYRILVLSGGTEYGVGTKNVHGVETKSVHAEGRDKHTGQRVHVKSGNLLLPQSHLKCLKWKGAMLNACPLTDPHSRGCGGLVRRHYHRYNCSYGYIPHPPLGATPTSWCRAHTAGGCRGSVGCRPDTSPPGLLLVGCTSHRHTQPAAEHSPVRMHYIHAIIHKLTILTT